MKTKLGLICMGALLICGKTIQAQQKKAQYDFSLLRQNDQVRIPRETSKSVYQKLKDLPLGEKSRISFGGSYRFQTEGFINEQFSSAVDQNDVWFLNRFQLHSHLKVGNQLEVFAELNSSVIGSKQNLSPVDKDELSVNQFFIRYHFNNRWSALIGRENMRLGSGRLVDIREGPNVRLSFDMVKLDYTDPNTELSAFYAVPVQPESGIFDNAALDFDTESLAGLYWTQTWHSAMRTDAYLLYKDEKNKTWNAGTADDQRVSLGFRHFGSWKELSYNNEFVFQTGSFGDQNISAWTASFNVELPSKLFGENAVVGIKTEAISGDTDASDNRLNTFDGLYPRGAYFGRVARIGPSNLFDVHPYIDTFVGPLSLEVDYVAFWRLSRQDGVYGPPLNLQYPAVNEQRFIGHQLGTIVGFEMNAFVNLELETNVIFPGDFLKDSGLGDTLFHAVFTAELKF